MEQMEHQLEKIDLLMNRTKLDFATARNLLEEANWDVLDAIAIYEEELQTSQRKIVERVKKLVRKGNMTTIRIKVKDRLVMEFPVTVGLTGSLLAPKLALLGIAACLLTKCSIEFDQLEELY